MNNQTRIKDEYLDINQRITSFDEVSLGYNKEQAIQEANRCLNCVNHPCVDGCPLNNRIPEFISKIKEDKIDEAYEIISSVSPFPSICSRVCSSETQCKSKCTRGINGDAISINLLERFVCDNHSNINNNVADKNNIKIAIIGAGPSGLSCAKRLATLGYNITIFDSYIKAGGVLTYGIPEFRLPKNIVDNEIDTIKKLNVSIVTNKKIDNYKELLNDYNYLYISTGTSVSNSMNIPGEKCNGVYDANDFLLKVNSNRNDFKKEIENKKVVVIGGGNVAIDVSRSAIRLQSKSVDILYRRSLNEMPANKDELQQALDEKVNFVELTVPKEIISENGHVTSIRCIKTRLGEPDEKGRRKPIEIAGSDYIVDSDIVVEAIGNSADLSLFEGLSHNQRGYVIIDSTGMTSNSKVYAGGDVVTGPYTVVNAIKAGIIAANSIHQKCINNK